MKHLDWKHNRQRNLNVFKTGCYVLVEVDGGNLGAELANAVHVFDVVATKLLSVHLIPFVLPLELLSTFTHKTQNVQPPDAFFILIKQVYEITTAFEFVNTDKYFRLTRIAEKINRKEQKRQQKN